MVGACKKNGTKDDLREMVDNLFDLYVNELSGTSLLQALVDGSWPEADEIIAFRRERVGTPDIVH